MAPYPAVRLLVAVVPGILAGVNLPLSLEVWLLLSAVALLSLLATLLYAKLRRGSPFPLFFSAFSYSLFVIFCFAAFSAYRQDYTPRDGLLPFCGKNVLVFGRIDGRPTFSESGAGWIMEVEEVFENGRTVKLHDRAKIFMRNGGQPGARLRNGDMVRVKGKLDLIPDAANRNEYDPRKAGRMKQLSVQLWCSGPWQVQFEGESRLNGFERFIVQPTYDYIMKSLDELIPEGQERKLSSGVLTGERETMSEEVFEAFKTTGTAHILAVSGMNVGLLALVIQIFLQRMKITTIGRWLSFLLFVFILIVYCSVTGNSASVKRAAFMALVLFGGETLGRKTYPVNSLALADFLILLFDPLDLLNPGFLMTNGAVLAIFLVYPVLVPSREKRAGFLWGIINALFSSVMITIAAIIGVSPVIAYYFGTFSVISLLANIPVVLFSTLLMYALVPMLLVNLVSGYAASFFAASSFFFAELTLQSALWFSRIPFASISIKPDAVEVWMYYVMVAVILFFIHRKKWGKVVVAMLLGANILFWYSFFFQPQPVVPALLTVNLGKNLAILFSTGSESVLIDAGKAPSDRKRIARQIDEYGLDAPTAVVQFYTPDSLIAQVPARKHLLRADTSLILPSVVIVRPEEKVVKIWSRKRSMLMASGTSCLKNEELYKADLAVLWVYRFADKQQNEIGTWLNYAHPGRCILVPGSFLSHEQLFELQRFAMLHPGVEVRVKTRQVVVGDVAS
ncbi:MAG: ComEC family competence protein [Chlorobium sp.]|nr:MAG: ComEC family competence protein [Chlorobium sp.]